MMLMLLLRTEVIDYCKLRAPLSKCLFNLESIMAENAHNSGFPFFLQCKK